MPATGWSTARGTLLKPTRFYAGLFLLAFSTLVLEIVETRLLSVVSWYHLAFFVISAAMFGMTAGAVWVYLRRDRFTAETLPADLARFTAAFAASIGLSLCVQVTLAPAMVLSFSTAIVFAEMSLALATPFFFSGVAVTLALTRSRFPVGRVYAIDLAGAALGCLGVIAFLDVVDGPSAILLAGATAAGAAALFAASGRGQARPSRGWVDAVLSRPLIILLVMGTLGVANSLTLHGIQPILVKFSAEKRDAGLVYEKWNSFSRVTVRLGAGGERALPPMWGPSPKMPQDVKIESRLLAIDGAAGAGMLRFDGDAKTAAVLAYDVTNLVYSARHSGRAAVIGVGGGRDVLSAWGSGFRDITGVEINPILVRLLTRDDLFARFAGLSSLPGVRLIADEARSWFARSRQRFDTIQMSMIDTWAATGAGAFTLSENGLYTVEAWKLFLDRLTDRGLFTVSRWYGPGAVNETGRMVSLAVAALLESGVARPEAHIFLAASGEVATLIASRSPLTAGDIATLRDACRFYEYTILISPGATPGSPVLAGIRSAGSRQALERYTSGLELDLTPPTDDRPFFFNVVPFHRPHRILRHLGYSAGVAGGNVTASLTLGTILLVSLALVVLTIVAPLRPAIRQGGRVLVVGGTAYFALLGVGFMLVEIGLLQRLSVFLGHPIYSLSVVLFSLILFTGAGSFLSELLRLEASRARLVTWSVLLGAYLLGLPHWLPAVIADFESSSTIARAGLSLAIVAPAGVLMGFGFPTGMRLVQAINERPTPWFWGINGGAGVLAAALAVAVSIAFGIHVTLTLGALCYLALVPAALALRSAAGAKR